MLYLCCIVCFECLKFMQMYVKLISLCDKEEIKSIMQCFCKTLCRFNEFVD